MHRGTCEFAPGGQGALVRVQACKSWQKRRVDIDQPALKAPHKLGSQNAHKARKHHDTGGVGSHRVSQCVIEFGTGGIRSGLNDLRGNALRAGPRKPLGVCALAEHCNNTRVPGLKLAGLHQRLHIGPTARYQHHDGLHGLHGGPSSGQRLAP